MRDLMDIKQVIANEVHTKYRYDAGRRGRDFLLTREDVFNLIYKNCYYCDSPPRQQINYRWPAGREIPMHNGMDRIDNRKGYLPENVVTCCWPCNSTKSDMTKQEWVAWLNRVAQHNRETVFKTIKAWF